MITFKYKKETEKELAHTDIIVNNEYVGYLIQEKSKFRTVGQNWFVIIKSGGSHPFSTKKKAVDFVKQIYNVSV